MLKKALTAGTLMAFSTFHAQAEELRVFNWAEYMGPETIANFEAETGIDVIYDTYDSIETLETRVLAGGSGFDIVFASAASMERFRIAGLLKEQDLASYKNYGNLDAGILERLKAYDPENTHSFPYMWGTVGLGYNPAMIESVYPGADMSNLDTLFDPESAAKLAKCGIAVLDSPNEILGIALNYLGYEANTGDKAEIEKATALMEGIRPSIRYFDNIKMIDDLATGEICVALSYSGDAAQAAYAAEQAGKNHEVLYTIPRNGTVLWIDVMAELAAANNSEAAKVWFDYFMRPEVVAEITNYLYYASANSAATPLVDEAISGDPEIYPPQEVADKLFPDVTLDNKAQRLRTRAWTRIKSGN